MKKDGFLILGILMLVGVLLFVLDRNKKIDLKKIVRFEGFKD